MASTPTQPSPKPLTISTKTGDAGTSGLANGERLEKDSTFFSVVGSLDELNSWVGVVVAQLKPVVLETKHPKLNTVLLDQLYTIQDTLFYVGAEVALSPKTELKKSHLAKLEKAADILQEKMSDNWTTQFLLPGGTKIGAWLDVARTVCRRVERELVAHQKTAAVRPLLAQYLNRLSDYLYLLRCYVNQELSYEEKKFDSQK